MTNPRPAQVAEGSARRRTSATPGAIYRAPKVSRRRRRCSGHLAEPHWIEVGDLVVHSSLPPNNPDIGNEGWWHAAFCLDCAPTPTHRPARATTPQES
jgi:hypothetical protein